MIGSVDEAVMGAIAVLNFIPILLLTNGRPGRATLVPGLDMYQSAFSNDQYGYGMAMGTLLFVVMLTRRPEQRPGHYQGRAASWLSLFSPSTLPT